MSQTVPATTPTYNSAQAFDRLINLGDLNGSTISINFAMLDEETNTPQFQTISISDGLADHFREFAANIIEKLQTKSQNHDLRLLPYAADYKPDDHELFWMQTTDDLISHIFTSIPESTDIPLIDFDSDFIRSIRFYMLIIELPNGRKVYVFRKYGKTKILNFSKNLFVRLYGDRYDRLEEPVFQFDGDYDAIAYDGLLIIKNKGNFEHIFKFYEMLQATAEAAMETIRATIPIANFEAFQTSCFRHLQKVAKLCNIAAKPYLRQVTMVDIRRTVERFALTVEIVEEDGEEKLLYDEQNKWQILHILDDAYLGSEMTNILYETNSKREHQVS